MSEATPPQADVSRRLDAATVWRRVQFAPPADWVAPESYDATIPAREGMHLTHLAWSRQMDARTGASFHLTAARLETSLAVQHESQWSLDLDARTQTLTLHWLRVVRDGAVIDQLQRERMRVMQRETQLERLVLDGRWTLLAVLDDVRPGDILECAYTYENRDLIRPESREALFAVPPAALVGRFRFTVFSESTDTALRWLASPLAPEPRIDTLPDGRHRWLWEGSQLDLRTEEPNAPDNAMDHIWVQVSNLAAWPVLARRVAEVWAGTGTLDDEADAEFPCPEKLDTTAILGLILRIQEDFRYLSVDLQAGGWTPSAPADVTRRRHGDCKDLAWLATNVLRRWGVKARPMLVATGFRDRVADLLPMAGLFNHAIIEVEWDGRRRWFDLTSKGHGGGYDDHVVGWFGHGLPVDVEDNELRSQPGKRTPGVYRLDETVILDTRRAGVSAIEFRLRTEGWQADFLRRTRFEQGVEHFAKEREHLAQQRYGNRLKRTGSLQWRDNREANVCELLETFEVPDLTYPESNRAIFEIPPSVIAQWFGLPPEGERRGAWSMPYPCEITHGITVKMGAPMGSAGMRKQWSEPEYEITLEEPRKTGAWTRIFGIRVQTPEIAPDRVPTFRKDYLAFLGYNGGKFQLHWGRARPRPGPRFGILDDLSAPPTDLTESAEPVQASSADAPPPRHIGRFSVEAPIDPASAKITGSSSCTRHRSRRRDGRRHSSGGWPHRVPGWVFFVPIVIAVALLRACIRGQ